jgi:hypothetical protein
MPATKLMQTCDDADLRREKDELNAESKRLDEQFRNHANRATYVEEKAGSEHQRAERDLTQGDTDARREVAKRYRKEADSARREVKRLEKAQADLAKRREQIEQRMRQARSPPRLPTSLRVRWHPRRPTGRGCASANRSLTIWLNRR